MGELRALWRLTVRGFGDSVNINGQCKREFGAYCNGSQKAPVGYVVTLFLDQYSFKINSFIVILSRRHPLVCSGP